MRKLIWFLLFAIFTAPMAGCVVEHDHDHDHDWHGDYHDDDHH